MKAPKDQAVAHPAPQQDPFSFAARAKVGVEDTPSTQTLRAGILPTVDAYALSVRTGTLSDDPEVQSRGRE